MVRDSSSAHISSAEETWHEIEDLIHEIAVLSNADLSAKDFHAELLDHAVRAMAAVAGAVWIRGPGGRLELRQQVELAETGLGASPEQQQQHNRLLESVLRSRNSW